MSSDTETTKVVFRIWKDSGDVLALFPEIPADTYGFYCNSYGRVGGHGQASYGNVIRYTRPATPEEYQSLKDELEKSYGYKLEVVKRAHPAMHNRRIGNAPYWAYRKEREARNEQDKLQRLALD